MRNQSVAAHVPAGSETNIPGLETLTGIELHVPAPVDGIEVVELLDRQQRKLNELRSHIDDLLDDGWVIAQRNPLTLQRNARVCYVLHGMLISDHLN
ncbi:hypothetical protein [uncultured Halopseudomonas sp.]|uniref:hypothetical protein n=1 Tax=uncultured Halopseudomonas sp. TaxID=2901193 RepID=UPI0030ECF582